MEVGGKILKLSPVQVLKQRVLKPSRLPSANPAVRDILRSAGLSAGTAQSLGIAAKLSEPSTCRKSRILPDFVLCRPLFSNATEPRRFGTVEPYHQGSTT